MTRKRTTSEKTRAAKSAELRHKLASLTEGTAGPLPIAADPASVSHGLGTRAIIERMKTAKEQIREEYPDLTDEDLRQLGMM